MTWNDRSSSCFHHHHRRHFESLVTFHGACARVLLVPDDNPPRIQSPSSHSSTRLSMIHPRFCTQSRAKMLKLRILPTRTLNVDPTRFVATAASHVLRPPLRASSIQCRAYDQALPRACEWQRNFSNRTMYESDSVFAIASCCICAR